MRYILYPPSPFCDCSLACVDGKSHAFLAKVVAELSDTGRMRLINEWMVDLANCGTGLDAGIAIDRKDFVQTTGIFSKSSEGRR